MTFEEILNFSPYSMDMEEKERFLTDRLSELTVHIHDYYGIVEQTGCIYMECERGHLHASIFSDVTNGILFSSFIKTETFRFFIKIIVLHFQAKVNKKVLISFLFLCKTYIQNYSTVS